MREGRRKTFFFPLPIMPLALETFSKFFVLFIHDSLASSSLARPLRNLRNVRTADYKVVRVLNMRENKRSVETLERN